VSVSADRVARDLKRLREATGTVVGSVFFGTLLQQMRESKLKGPYGHGGRGEEIFASQLHGLLAERAGNTMQRGLAQAIYRRLEAQQTRISRDTAQGGGV
jgi:Rod binding domain-containing protein